MQKYQTIHELYQNQYQWVMFSANESNFDQITLAVSKTFNGHTDEIAMLKLNPGQSVVMQIDVTGQCIDTVAGLTTTMTVENDDDEIVDGYSFSVSKVKLEI